MYLKSLYGWIVLAFFCLGCPAFAQQPLTLTQTSTKIPVGTFSEILIDPNGVLSFDEARNSVDFEPVLVAAPNMGMTQDTHWMKFKVKNDSSLSDWMFVVHVSTIDHIQVWWRQGNGGFTQASLNEEGILQREYRLRLPVLRLDLPPGSETEFWVRIWDEGTTHYPVEIWKPASFYLSYTRETAIFGLLLGGLGILVLYNFFIWASTRSRRYFYYFMYVTGFFLFDFWYYGFTLMFFPEWIWSPSSNRFVTGSLGFGLFWMVTFSRKFLDIKSYAPRIDRVLVWNTALMNLGTLISLSPFFIEGALFMNIFALPLFLLLLWAGVLALKNHNPSAKHYLIASGFMIVGTFITALRTVGLTEANLLTENGVFVGGVLEALFLSFGLAAMFNRMKGEKADAQTALLAEREAYSSQLEVDVAQRTEDLLLANSTKDQFFSIIAHDLKGPLGSLKILFDTFVKPGKTLEPTLHQEIVKSTTGVYDLTKNLLNWSQGQRKLLEPKKEHFCLNQVIEETLDLLKQSAEFKEVGLVFEPGPELFVYADRDMTLTVTRNLISNGVKFCRAHDTVSCRLAQEAQRILLSVEDTGVGIALEKRKQLFLPGDNKSAMGTSGEQGTGLGLLLCKEFVEANQGEIGVQSELNQGSRFWFSLPVGSKEKTQEKTDRSALFEWLEDLPVLLVEDNPLHLKTSKQALQRLGMDVRTALDGEQGLLMFQSQRFEILFMDINLPLLNGIECLERMSECCEDMPLSIALTDYSKKELVDQYAHFGFDGLLNKPLEVENLLDVLSENWA